MAFDSLLRHYSKRSTPDVETPEVGHKRTCGANHFCEDVRKAQIEILETFIKHTAKNKSLSSRVAVVHGPPGSGKTATVHHVLETLPPNFRVVSLLGEKFTGTSGLVLLLEQIIQQSFPIKRQIIRRINQHKTIKERFARLAKELDNGRNFALFVDEIDMTESAFVMLDKNKSRSESCLFIIMLLFQHYLTKAALLGTTNDIAFTRRLWDAYECEPLVISMEPYVFEDMMTIAKCRGIDVHNRSLKLGVRKIAGQAGDCRQVLDLVLRLTKDNIDGLLAEVMEHDDSSPTRTDTESEVFNVASLSTVTLVQNPVEEVLQVLGRRYQNPVARVVEVIKALPNEQKLTCAAIMITVDRVERRTDLKVHSIYIVYREVTDLMAVDPVSRATFSTSLRGLEDYALLLIKNAITAPPTPQLLNKTPRSIRSRTPVSRRRPHIQHAVADGNCSNSCEWSLSLKENVIAFKKLKKAKIYAFNCLRLRDQCESDSESD